MLAKLRAGRSRCRRRRRRRAPAPWRASGRYRISRMTGAGDIEPRLDRVPAVTAALNALNVPMSSPARVHKGECNHDFGGVALDPETLVRSPRRPEALTRVLATAHAALTMTSIRASLWPRFPQVLHDVPHLMAWTLCPVRAATARAVPTGPLAVTVCSASRQQTGARWSTAAPTRRDSVSAGRTTTIRGCVDRGRRRPAGAGSPP